uniref:LolMLc n=1 Tax=Bichromomyia olmeca TaxID=715919 RepID=A0A1B1V3F9_9DIPT|nr:LolMLc [Bichromomyia olmeca]
MIRFYILVISSLIPFALGGAWYRMYWEYDCPGYKRPLDYSIVECPPYTTCSKISKVGDFAVMHVNYTFKVENGPYAKLPISGQLMRYPSGKVEKFFLGDDACGKGKQYLLKEKCPLQNGIHWIQVKLIMRNVKLHEFIKVALRVNDPSDKPLACVYAGAYANGILTYY